MLTVKGQEMARKYRQLRQRISDVLDSFQHGILNVSASMGAGLYSVLLTDHSGMYYTYTFDSHKAVLFDRMEYSSFAMAFNDYEAKTTL